MKLVEHLSLSLPRLVLDLTFTIDWISPFSSSTPSTQMWRNPRTQDPLRTSLSAWSFMTKWRMEPWCWGSWNTSSCLLVIFIDFFKDNLIKCESLVKLLCPLDIWRPSYQRCLLHCQHISNTNFESIPTFWILELSYSDNMLNAGNFQ